MGLRVGTALIGLIGGIAWLAVLLVDRVSDNDAMIDALTWTGLILVGVAALGAGASLVSRSVVGLQVVVSVGFAALAGSILALLTDSYDDQAVYGAFGVLAVVSSVVALTRSRQPAGGHAETHRSGGTHAR